MKYILICIIVLAVCVAVSILITWLIGRKKKIRKALKVLLAVIFTVILILISVFIYLGIYYHADEEAGAYLKGGNNVEVIKTENGYLFDGPGEGSAVIFYPGAKVEADAYAPMLYRLAEEGSDCFLVNMPFNFPLMGANSAETLIGSYDYDTWYLAGHSMGGLMACSYAQKHPSDVRGLILFASYPAKELGSGIKLLSVYGSRDGCLSMEQYEKGKAYWPDDSQEFIIEGGNHAGFGNYGPQSGDNEALISAEEQQSLAVKVISEWIGE